MKYFYLLLLFISSYCYSQSEILDKYPPNMSFYDKGELNFLKELQNSAKENDIKPCENKSDFYKLAWIVYPDKSIKFIKDPDTISVGKNKCAYDFAKKTFKYLKDWNPVIINGKSYAALVQYEIYPSDILAYKISDDLLPDFKQAEYPGGKDRFFRDMERIIQNTMSKYRINLNGETVNLSFKVSKEGLMKDIKFSSNIPFTTIDDLTLDLKKLNKWKPATRNEVPMESSFNNVSISFRY